jgi:16S rRNA (cytosine967-C5)-methyltransferase
MRVGLYQILFLDKVPDHAAVNEAVEFVKRLQGQKSADLTNAVLRNIIRSKNGIRYPKPEEDIAGYLSAYYSHPSWLVKRWIKRYGEEFTKNLLIANNNKPNLTLRVNHLVTNKEEFKSLLDKVELKYSNSDYHPEFIRLANLTNITDWQYFAKGYFAVQDESTAFSCKLLDVKPGMRVLDLCSAPGGKTAFLADLMNNEGEIVAIDRYDSRLKILEKNLERMNVKNVKTIAVDAEEYKDEPFDRILVDVPCSGLGTLTKKPDIKWKRDLGDIRKLTKIQSRLLEKSTELVKEGGYIVYSTCTIEPEENIEIINQFLLNHPEFKLEKADGTFPKELLDSNGCIQTYPHIHSIDGAFAVKLKKEGSIVN